MSQPVTFEMEGTCSDGQMIVVKGWPDLGCQDVPQSTQRVIEHTTIKRVQNKPQVQAKSLSLWWLIALMVITSVIVVTIGHLLRDRRY